jgi:cytochrome c peroxidase
MPIIKYFLPFSIILLVAISCRNNHVRLAGSEAQLGEKLFSDPILSRDSTVSCAGCHVPDHAFADVKPTSKGVFNRIGNRNAPSCMNMSNRNSYFWDGRAETLEEQAMGPIENPVEMDLPLTIAVKRLRNNSYYNKSFYNIYGEKPNKELIAKAISAFERTLETSGSAFDKYIRDNDKKAISESAKRGHDIFLNKGKCFECHFGGDFSGNDDYKNIGLYNGKDLNDKGRFEISGKENDLGKFKTPGLRNIAVTSPYMHNGMHKTLMDVINYYNEPDKFVKNSINRDTVIKALGLTETEKKDLESFLLSLTDERFLKTTK